MAAYDPHMAETGTIHIRRLGPHEGAEVFLYDIAVAPDQQRRGIGRQLVDALRREASSQGISTMFVPADDDDTHALRFYAALGGKPSKVTLFEFSSPLSAGNIPHHVGSARDSGDK